MKNQRSKIMSNIEPIKPFVVDSGVELYSTDLGTGVSISAAGIMFGVSRARVSEVVAALQSENPESLKGRPGAVSAVRSSKILKPLLGKDLFLEGAFLNGAKPLHSKVFAKLCRYFAEELGSEKAQYSLEKFEDIGIDSWIRNVTGHTIAPAIDPAQAALQLAMQLIEVQRELNLSQARLIESSEAKQVRDSFIQQGEGLKMMFDEFETEPDDLNEYPCPDKVNGIPRKYSIKEYLSLVQEVDLSTIDRGTMSGYGRKVADTFKTHQIAPPEERLGKKGGIHKVYAKSDFPLLATAWESYRRERALENIKKLG
jgi:hypothetical protein